MPFKIPLQTFELSKMFRFQYSMRTMLVAVAILPIAIFGARGSIAFAPMLADQILGAGWLGSVASAFGISGWNQDWCSLSINLALADAPLMIYCFLLNAAFGIARGMACTLTAVVHPVAVSAWNLYFIRIYDLPWVMPLVLLVALSWLGLFVGRRLSRTDAMKFSAKTLVVGRCSAICFVAGIALANNFLWSVYLGTFP